MNQLKFGSWKWQVLTAPPLCFCTCNTGLSGIYMRPGRTQTGMSSYRPPYISFLAFTWDRSENELRPVWIRVGRRTETSYFRTGLSSYRSHVNDNESQTGSGSSMFLLLASSFLLFLSNDSITIADNIVDNIRKQDVESSINWIYACVNAGRESAILRYCPTV